MEQKIIISVYCAANIPDFHGKVKIRYKMYIPMRISRRFGYAKST